MANFGWLLCLPKLLSLTLHNIQGTYSPKGAVQCEGVTIADVEDSLQSVCQLKLLRHLDVSQCNESRGQLKEPTEFLETLVLSLPCLESLDISGSANNTIISSAGMSPLFRHQPGRDWTREEF